MIKIFFLGIALINGFYLQGMPRRSKFNSEEMKSYFNMRASFPKRFEPLLTPLMQIIESDFERVEPLLASYFEDMNSDPEGLLLDDVLRDEEKTFNLIRSIFDINKSEPTQAPDAQSNKMVEKTESLLQESEKILQNIHMKSLDAVTKRTVARIRTLMASAVVKSQLKPAIRDWSEPTEEILFLDSFLRQYVKSELLMGQGLSEYKSFLKAKDLWPSSVQEIDSQMSKMANEMNSLLKTHLFRLYIDIIKLNHGKEAFTTSELKEMQKKLNNDIVPSINKIIKMQGDIADKLSPLLKQEVSLAATLLLAEEEEKIQQEIMKQRALQLRSKSLSTAAIVGNKSEDDEVSSLYASVLCDENPFDILLESNNNKSSEGKGKKPLRENDSNTTHHSSADAHQFKITLDELRTFPVTDGSFVQSIDTNDKKIIISDPRRDELFIINTQNIVPQKKYKDIKQLKMHPRIAERQDEKTGITAATIYDHSFAQALDYVIQLYGKNDLFSSEGKSFKQLTMFVNRYNRTTAENKPCCAEYTFTKDGILYHRLLRRINITRQSQG